MFSLAPAHEYPSFDRSAKTYHHQFIIINLVWTVDDVESSIGMDGVYTTQHLSLKMTHTNSYGTLIYKRITESRP